MITLSPGAPSTGSNEVTFTPSSDWAQAKSRSVAGTSRKLEFMLQFNSAAVDPQGPFGNQAPRLGAVTDWELIRQFPYKSNEVVSVSGSKQPAQDESQDAQWPLVLKAFGRFIHLLQRQHCVLVEVLVIEHFTNGALALVGLLQNLLQNLQRIGCFSIKSSIVD